MSLLRDKQVALIGEQTGCPYWRTTGCPYWGTNRMSLLGGKQVVLFEGQMGCLYWESDRMSLLGVKQVALIGWQTGCPYWGINRLPLLSYLSMRSISSCGDKMLMARYCLSRHIWENRSNWCLEKTERKYIIIIRFLILYMQQPQEICKNATGSVFNQSQNIQYFLRKKNKGIFSPVVFNDLSVFLDVFPWPHGQLSYAFSLGTIVPEEDDVFFLLDGDNGFMGAHVISFLLLHLHLHLNLSAYQSVKIMRQWKSDARYKVCCNLHKSANNAIESVLGYINMGKGKETKDWSLNHIWAKIICNLKRELRVWGKIINYPYSILHWMHMLQMFFVFFHYCQDVIFYMIKILFLLPGFNEDVSIFLW